MFTKAEISFAISSSLCCWFHRHTTGPLNLKDYLETCSNSMAEVLAGEMGSTASSGRERRPVTLCGRWSCSVLHWTGHSAEATAIWQQHKGQKKLQGYAITHWLPSLSQAHLSVEHLSAQVLVVGHVSSEDWRRKDMFLQWGLELLLLPSVS